MYRDFWDYTEGRMLQKLGVIILTVLNYHRLGPVAGSYEHTMKDSAF